MRPNLLPTTIVLCLLAAGCAHRPDANWVTLFTTDGPPAGWLVRNWADVSQPPAEPVTWEVKAGVLHGGEPRGSWLVSEREYDDFIVEFDFKLGERGNSGLALRTPMKGDPAFDAIELQMADLRYNPEAKDSELTGGIYRAIAPRQQVYRPTEWNHYRVELRGPKLLAWLNGTLIQDVNFDLATAEVKRHDGTDAVPLAQRPRRGHIGFQELSRGGDHALIRNARLRELK